VTRPGGRRDIAFALVSVGLVVWVLLSGVTTSAPVGATVGAVAWVVGCYLVGRLLGPQRDLVARCAGAALLLAVAVSGGFADRSPPAPPLGYANADAALVVAAVGLVLVGSQADDVSRLMAGALAVVAAGWTLWTGAVAASASLALLIVAAALAGRLRSELAAVAAAAVAVLLLAATAMLGVAAPIRLDDGPGGVLVGQLSERRVALWGDAVELAARHPLLGVGPQQFPERSQVAMRDADTAAAHSLGLELAAEIGLVGLALVAVLIWLLLAAAGGGQGHVAVLAVTTVTAFLLQASVDYVADYLAVTGATALAVGLGTRAHSAPGLSETKPSCP